jgi:uncharacterized protein YjbI with pentapeptide repeats
MYRALLAIVLFGGLFSGAIAIAPETASAATTASLRIGDVAVVANTTSLVTVNSPLALSAAPNVAVCVSYHTVDGTATGAPELTTHDGTQDYQSASGVVTVGPGKLTASITTIVNYTTIGALGGSYSVVIDNATAATGNKCERTGSRAPTVTVARGVGTVTIEANIGSTPTVTAGDVSVFAVHNPPTITAQQPIGLSAPLVVAECVWYHTVDGTATGAPKLNTHDGSQDYQSAAGVVEIAAGETGTTIATTVNYDSVAEFNESYFVVIDKTTKATANKCASSDAQDPGVTIGGARGTVRILSTSSFAGADLSGKDLSNLDLSSLDLSNANLSNTQLEFTNLSGSNLTGANLSGAVGEMTNLRNANLTDADLHNASMPGRNFGLRVFVEGADMTGADLSNADFSGADLGGILGGSIGVGGYLAGVLLTDANLDNTNFSATHLAGVQSGGLTGTPAVLPSNSWHIIGGYLIGPGADLSNADLSNFDLGNMTLTDMRFVSTNLTGANLAGATVSGDLSRANFAGANLTGASVSHNSLVPSFASFVDADLSGATLGGNLEGINLSSDDLTGVTFASTDLTHAVLTDANLAGKDLSGATLAHTRLDGANLTGTNLAGANLGPAFTQYGAGWTSLTNANLTDANLGGANLSGADISGVVWNTTICPDLTNSNSNGGTCLGHI